MRWRTMLASVLLVAFLAAPQAGAQSSTQTFAYDPHGRLVKVVTSGGPRNGGSQSICYDDAGNRTSYAGNRSSGSTTCPSQTNDLPVTRLVLTSRVCLPAPAINLTSDDSDPEVNAPLLLTAIGKTDGGVSAIMVSSSSMRATFGLASDISTFSFSEENSLGAASQSMLTDTSSSCGSRWPYRN